MKKIRGKLFKKSSFSTSKCVGVAFHSDKVFVTNITTKAPIVTFTKDEWQAFVKGVKNCEFDIVGE